jgi:hypothetical protein
MLGPHQRDVTCPAWNQHGDQLSHVLLETVTNSVMAMVRRLDVALVVLSQRGSTSTGSLIRRALPRISGEFSRD